MGIFENDTKETDTAERLFTVAYRRFTQLLWLFTTIAFVGCLAWLAVSLHEEHVKMHDVGLIVAGLFVAGGLPISIWEIGMHLQYYTRSPEP